MQFRDHLVVQGIKQIDVARAAQVSKSRVSHWVTGHAIIPAERAKVIHDKLGVPLSLMRPDLWDASSDVRAA